MTDLHVTLRPPRAEGPADGAPVLLVHGTMDRATSFTRLAQQLPDWTVITYDRRGYAHSNAVPPSNDFSVQIDDLLGVLDAEAADLDGRPVTALGHSIGGAALLGAAARRPQAFRGVVAYEPPMSWEPWWGPGRGTWDVSDPAQMAERFMRQVLGDRLWERLPAATRAERRREGRTMLAEVTAVADRAPFDPAAIAVPTIIARGSDATDRHARAAQELAAAIPGAEAVVLAGADHGAHISHPAELAGLIRRVAARAEAEAAG